jgi:hypothetical protein
MFRKGYLNIAAVIVLTIMGCNSKPVDVTVTEKITVSIPASKDDITTESTGYSINWKASFEDDYMAIYRFEVLVPDSTITEGSLAELKNHTNDFLSTFEIQDIDSLYSVEANHLKADLSFDYLSDDEKYRFFGSFLLKDTTFVVICYITPFPVDGFSKKRKDKIFESVTVK